VELLNPDILSVSDRQADFPAVDFMVLELYDETPEQVRDIAAAFMSGRPAAAKNITRGLYYRGVARNEA
jgi:hypothetical protein